MAKPASPHAAVMESRAGFNTQSLNDKIRPAIASQSGFEATSTSDPPVRMGLSRELYPRQARL